MQYREQNETTLPAGFYPNNACPLKVPTCRVLRVLHTVVYDDAWEKYKSGTTSGIISSSVIEQNHYIAIRPISLLLKIIHRSRDGLMSIPRPISETKLSQTEAGSSG
jgi:hypothetical protein